MLRWFRLGDPSGSLLTRFVLAGLNVRPEHADVTLISSRTIIPLFKMSASNQTSRVSRSLNAIPAEHGVSYATIVALLLLSRFPRFPVAIFWSLGMTILRVFFAILGFRRIGVRPSNATISFTIRKLTIPIRILRSVISIPEVRRLHPQ